MKNQIVGTLLFTVILMGLFHGQKARADDADNNCHKFSDTFETFDDMKWAEVLYYSKSQGIVSVKDGKLVLESPQYEPCEIEVYSLFTFEGDFDAQSDYNIIFTKGENKCRFNAGLVWQTLGYEKNYKTYVSVNPAKNPFSKARLDLEDEKKIEKYNGSAININGSLRVIRKNNIISSYKNEGGKWVPIYQFKTFSDEKLRMRFKLQTGIENKTENEACPATIMFDNFKINSCSNILVE